ncbi:MAG TPA: hypothetical protein VFI47_21395, partial [Acidimicrobiales bacterium]|nr:hypothetical protein [Acidimicrobiales bacterium]
MAEKRWSRRTRGAVGLSIAAVLLLVAAACGEDDEPATAGDTAGAETGGDGGDGVLGPVDAATGEPLR